MEEFLLGSVQVAKPKSQRCQAGGDGSSPGQKAFRVETFCCRARPSRPLWTPSLPSASFSLGSNGSCQAAQLQLDRARLGLPLR